MPQGPLLAALATRALDQQEAARPRRRRFRRLAARVGRLAAATEAERAQISSGTILIAPDGHSETHIPHPLQKSRSIS
jgi:hypothetical protein